MATVAASAAIAAAVSLWLNRQPEASRLQTSTHTNADSRVVRDPIKIEASSKADAKAHLADEHGREALEKNAKRLYVASAPELFGIYRWGVGSASVKERYIALQALDYCLPIVLALQLQLPTPKDGATAAAIERSRAELRGRCADFYKEPPSELLANKKKLLDSIQQADSEISSRALELSREPDSAEVQRVRANLLDALGRDGATSMLWSRGGLISWLDFAQGNPKYAEALDDSLKNSATLGEATIIASCQLGFDCGKSSLMYIGMCINTGLCDDSVAAAVLSSMHDEETRKRVLLEASVISMAIKSGRLSKLGLRANN